MLPGPGKASEMRRSRVVTPVNSAHLRVSEKKKAERDCVVQKQTVYCSDMFRLLSDKVINPFSEYQWTSDPYPSYNMPRVRMPCSNVRRDGLC